MNDRELLEMAAKAAGHRYDMYHASGLLSDNTPYGESSSIYDCWNPLTDDGDALRLAVSLSMVVQTKSYDDYDRCYASARIYDDCSLEVCSGIEHYDSEVQAATRRAIVRAAAEIGRNMK